MMSDEQGKDAKKTPLIVNQKPKNTKGTKPLQYEFGTDTYDVYRNPKNPFLGRILDTSPAESKIDPQHAHSLLQKVGGHEGYEPSFPGAGAPHRKRKLVSTGNSSGSRNGYRPESILPQDDRKLQNNIGNFFQYALCKLKDDSKNLPELVNELLPLFLEHKIRVCIYPAYRQFQSFEEMFQTLEKISEDTEIENFELFCSALFGYYSQMG